MIVKVARADRAGHRQQVGLDLLALVGAAVDVDRGAETVTVTVTGTAPSFVPGLNTAVDVTVTGPVERWVD